MEMEQFDDLTRHLSGAGSSRRQALRALGGALFGSALAGVAARLGVTEGAAKAKKHGGKAKRTHQDLAHPSQERQAPEPPHPKAASGVQSEGKGKGKGHHKPPPLPPGCEDCTECQMCKRGQCVPDPALARVRCQGSGTACGYCQGGVCTASEEQPCADGVCPAQGPVLSRGRHQAVHRSRNLAGVLLRGQVCLLPRHRAHVRQRLVPSPGGLLPGTKAVRPHPVRGPERVLPGREALSRWHVCANGRLLHDRWSAGLRPLPRRRLRRWALDMPIQVPDE